MMNSQKKINTLAERVTAANSVNDYNIANDLKKLNELLGIVNQKTFRNKLLELIEKYESEPAQILAAVAEKARSGDFTAVRLYTQLLENQPQPTEDDGLIEALKASGKEAFKDEL